MNCNNATDPIERERAFWKAEEQGWTEQMAQLRGDLAAQKELADVAVAEANASEAECLRLRADLAAVTAERDRLEHDINALSKYCLGQAVMFAQNPNVCQVYSELQAKTWAIVSLFGRERIESERHQYTVELGALREEIAVERAELAETRKALERQDRAVLSMNDALESTRAELARSEARVNAAIAELTRQPWDIQRALETLRG